jgi:hypothetical protein
VLPERLGKFKKLVTLSGVQDRLKCSRARIGENGARQMSRIGRSGLGAGGHVSEPQACLVPIATDGMGLGCLFLQYEWKRFSYETY